jgi:DHA1 family multidrug resistance protein-like MFS transporter
LYLSVFTSSLGLGLYIYFIPVFAQTFGATFLDLGFIGSAYAVTYAVAPVLIGYLADKLNRAWLFTLGLAVNAVATVVLVFVRNIGDIVILRLLGGVGYSFFWPTAEVLVADIAPANRRVKEMGTYSVAWASGFLIGPLIGGFMIQNFGYAELFLIATALIAVAFVFSLIWLVPGYKRTFVLSSKSFGTLPSIRTLIPWYLVMVFYGVTFSVINSIYPGYANSLGVDAALIGLTFTVFGIARIFVFATSERYLLFGENRTMVIASVIIAAGLIAIAQLHDFVGFLGAMVLLGGSFAAIGPLMINIISRYFPKDKLGVAVGSYETVFGVGAVIGPLLAGTIASLASVQVSFFLVSTLGLLMVGCIWTGRRTRKDA